MTMQEDIFESLKKKFAESEIRDEVLELVLDNDELLDGLTVMTTKFTNKLKECYEEFRIKKLHGTPEYTLENINSLKKDIQKIKIRILLSDTTSMQKIEPALDGTPIMAESVILYVDEPKSYIVSGQVVCQRCNASLGISIDYDYRVNFDSRCSSCNQGTMEIDKSSLKFDWMQYIFLEEIPDQAKKNSPRKLTARIVGDLVGEAFIGQRKRFVGIPKTIIENDEDESHSFIVDIISFKDMDEEGSPVIDVDEMLSIQSRSETDEKYIGWLCDSFAPHIKNRNLEKLSMLLSLVSGTRGFDLRSRSHCLIVGNAGQGKSEMGKFAEKIVTKGQFIDCTAVSQSGLVFGLDKLANGQQVPTAGAAVLNNGGVLILDEFDKASTQRKTLHSVLEQGVAIYSKIKKAKAPAIITMIALANPKYLSWKDGEDTMYNLEHIETTILDRCDVILRMKPIVDVEKSVKQLESFIDGANNEPENPDLMSIKQYKAFLYYVKKIEPKIDTQAKQKLLQFFGEMKRLHQPEGSLPMEQRQGEGLVRLCISMARLYFKPMVDCAIVDKVIDFYKKTLETLGMNTDAGISQMPMEKYHLKKEDAFWQAVKLVEKDADGYFNESDVLKLLADSPNFPNNSGEAYFDDLVDGKNKKLLKRGGKFKKL